MMANRHTAETLTQEFWSRRKEGACSVNLSAKQVGWLVSLLRRMDRGLTRTHSYTLPTTGTPLALVVYPNGAGFIKVEDFAMEFDHAARRWRIKDEYR